MKKRNPSVLPEQEDQQDTEQAAASVVIVDSGSETDESTVCETLDHAPNTPLWQRVPTKDDSGNYLGDFMMIIPGLKKSPPDKRREILNKLAGVLEFYQETIVFADLNMKMNLLWVSIKPVKGMFIEIPAAIISQIPEAKLISDRTPTA